MCANNTLILVNDVAYCTVPLHLKLTMECCIALRGISISLSNIIYRSALTGWSDCLPPCCRYACDFSTPACRPADPQERMNSLERLRREVDGQRRKAEKKFSRAEAKLRKSYLGAGYGSSSSR